MASARRYERLAEGNQNLNKATLDMNIRDHTRLIHTSNEHRK